MAIRPVDLQLAYLAAPQSAAQAASAQEAPAAANAAAQASFAAHLREREEQVEESDRVEHAVVRERPERDPSAGREYRQGDRRRNRSDEEPDEPVHLIDVTA